MTHLDARRCGEFTIATREADNQKKDKRFPPNPVLPSGPAGERLKYKNAD